VRAFRIVIVAVASAVVVVAVVMLANVGTDSADVQSAPAQPTTQPNVAVVAATPGVTIVRHGTTTFVVPILHP
jgi:Flp pilus assembly protein CpaB